VPSEHTTVVVEFDGTTTVVFAGGGGLLLLMQPANRNGASNPRLTKSFITFSPNDGAIVDALWPTLQRRSSSDRVG
jgi:hypothetical protein